MPSIRPCCLIKHLCRSAAVFVPICGRICADLRPYLCRSAAVFVPICGRICADLRPYLCRSAAVLYLCRTWPCCRTISCIGQSIGVTPGPNYYRTISLCRVRPLYRTISLCHIYWPRYRTISLGRISDIL